MNIVKSVHVVLVSPNDVAEERDAVRTVVEMANHVASQRGIVFDLRLWEDVAPGYHPEGAQALIDSELAIELCDLLIGVFWKRYGVIDAPPYFEDSVRDT